MKIKQVEFDELDKKFLSEMPLLIDVFTSTFKKMGNILRNQFEIIENETSLFLEKYDDWKLSEKNYFKNYHYPFCSEVKPKISITDIEEYYRIDYYRYAYKGMENKSINGFQIWTGFEYNKEEDIRPHLFYKLYREFVDKIGGVNIPYETLNSLKKIDENIEIYHPSKGGKEEAIHFYNYDIYDSKIIEEKFEIFRTNILLEYLNNIKW